MIRHINISKKERLPQTFGGVQKKSILQNILLFCRILKQLKINITTGRVLDLLRSLKYINIAKREDFYYTFRANLISQRNEIPTFDQAFQAFWRLSGEMQSVQEMDRDKNADNNTSLNEHRQRIKETLFLDEWSNEKTKEALDKREVPEFSPVETLATKDFSDFTDKEIERIKDVIVQMIPKIATKKSRRRHLDLKGREFDFRRTLRMNLRYGGEILALARRKRRIKKIKLITLSDVSGSMDCYSKFFIQFIYMLQDKLKGVETFVFSTRLTRITDLLRNRSVNEALTEISRVVLHWSGGTTIGSCLKTFNDEFAPGMLNKRTVVMIISDGWDRDNSNLLEYQMMRLKRNCRKIIWLNPLLGSPGYQPLCRGMKAALPYLSYFLPLNNLSSLMALGKTLNSVL